MRLALDSERCEGHARCMAALPTLFDSDEFGYAVLLEDGEVPASMEDRARQAVRNCPEHAITEVGAE
jgi:ferredoxin